MGQPNLDEGRMASCKQPGGLSIKKVHRMSTPVVVIGWLLLVPSFFDVVARAIS